MKDIERARDRLVEELRDHPSKDDRFSAIVKKGKETRSLSETDRSDKFLVKGCLSRVWLIPRLENGIVYFTADSEALIVKGIAVALVNVYSGHSPEDILELDPAFLKEAGIEEALSMNRRSGLSNMIKQIKLYAAAYKAILSKD